MSTMAEADYPPITKPEAMEVVRRSAWTDYGYNEPLAEACQVVEAHLERYPHEVIDAIAALRSFVDAGTRRMVHTVAGFGCDLTIESVNDWIKEATEVRWADSLFGVVLAIQAPDGRWRAVDSIAESLRPPRPQRKPEPWMVDRD